MNTKNFEEELLKALGRPKEWDVVGAYLQHEKTGVRMLTYQIHQAGNPGNAYVLVSNSENDHLTFIDGEAPVACLHAVVNERAVKTREKAEAQKRVNYLRKFKGFK